MEYVKILFRDSPFFLGLISHINFFEIKKGIAHISVDYEDGIILCYNKEYLQTLDESYQIGIFKHEFLHLLLQHVFTSKEYYYDLGKKWLSVTDICVNSFLINELPKEEVTLQSIGLKENTSAQACYNFLTNQNVKIELANFIIQQYLRQILIDLLNKENCYKDFCILHPVIKDSVLSFIEQRVYINQILQDILDIIKKPLMVRDIHNFKYKNYDPIPELSLLFNSKDQQLEDTIVKFYNQKIVDKKSNINILVFSNESIEKINYTNNLFAIKSNGDKYEVQINTKKMKYLLSPVHLTSDA